MMFHTRYNNKNAVECVPCVPSCLPLFGNGTHRQTLPIKQYKSNVYHVYHYARVRVRVFFLCLTFSTKTNQFKNELKKFSCVRKLILMVNMVNISLKTLSSKALLCVPFFYLTTQKSLNVNIVIQVIDFKNQNMCTIVGDRI